MAKNTQNTPQLNKKETFLKALEANLGNIKESCKATNIHRRTYYLWCEKDKKFKEECNSVQEGLIDLAESQLLTKIKNGDITAIIFFLKCRAKSRGYNERTELELIRPIKEIDFEDI